MGFIRTLLGKDTTTDVLDLLTAQHEEVDQLFEQIETGGGDRRGLLIELADKLAAHATVEEEVFYPAVMAKTTSDMLHESVEEHLAIKRLLADLITMRLEDDAFNAKIKVLKEQVSHHAHKEEEEKLFPEVRSLMNAAERAGIGNELLVMFEELLAQSPHRQVPNETDKAASLPALS
jgi:hemerythrin superfamily protein